MKIKVALIFGGKSAEHEVSLRSASNIFNAIDKEKFDVILLGIDKDGNWCFNSDYLSDKINLAEDDYFLHSKNVIIENIENNLTIIFKQSHKILGTFNVAFSIIHGTSGEDGTLQGFFKSKNIPFVGSDILGSAICMDKDVTKRLLRDWGIPVANFMTLHKFELNRISFEEAKERFGLPIFIKPCNAGSSVGVNKVYDAPSFVLALTEAFLYDNKILIEEAITGKEVECAILGNENPKASVVGEIILSETFYSYDAKYHDAKGAKIKIPAEIPDEILSNLRRTAINAFKATCCEGMARVDFFLRKDNTFVVNEINTLPGFTEISMYPKLWEYSGITYSDLISNLIELSLNRDKKNMRLQTVKR
ncbi:MAG: D-alanine--D-alanine ligase [Chitinophagaceae bacterium]|nr:MAG: D-alanine--D-alanine ligase [Chitinophagaceae bacterium]